MITDDGHLQMFVIYKDAIDLPPGYSVRRWVVHPGHTTADPDPFIVSAVTLDDARAAIRDSVGVLYCMAREPDDDPVIVETWL